MPSLPDADDFPFRSQDPDIPECVPVCVAMVYDYPGIDHDWEDLLTDLDFSPAFGTPFENIRNLRRVRIVSVSDLDDLHGHLSASTPRPVIANLLVTDDELLGYHLPQDLFLHAVVVVGVTDLEVTFTDPLSQEMFSTTFHRSCSRRVFADAWMGGFALLPPWPPLRLLCAPLATSSSCSRDPSPRPALITAATSRLHTSWL